MKQSKHSSIMNVLTFFVIILIEIFEKRLKEKPIRYLRTIPSMHSCINLKEKIYLFNLCHIVDILCSRKKKRNEKKK